MKAIMISVKPKYCSLIANGKKAIEVRKTRPKLETPFKCYIYCTSGAPYLNRHNGYLYLEERDTLGGRGHGIYDRLNRKVIGEFVCDEIYQYSTGNIDGQTISKDEMQKQSCLTYDELSEYENSAEPRENCIYLVGLYGWHISALQIYDKPRELSEFHKPEMPTGLRYEDDAIKCPPKSWAYVEEYDGKR